MASLPSASDVEFLLHVVLVTGDREPEETNLWWSATKEVTVWSVALRLGERWVASASWGGREVPDFDEALEGVNEPDAVLYVRRDAVAHGVHEERLLEAMKPVLDWIDAEPSRK